MLLDDNIISNWFWWALHELHLIIKILMISIGCCSPTRLFHRSARNQRHTISAKALRARFSVRRYETLSIAVPSPSSPRL